MVVCLVLPLAALAVSGSLLPARADAASAVATRAEDPVTVTGIQLDEFSDEQISSLALFRYEAASGSFVPIPFQIDEVVDHVFNPGNPFEFVQRTYDIFNEDDGKLDDIDELVFLFGDGGPQAPADAAWPFGASADRYEIRAIDPRTGAPQPDRYVYLFAGSGLPRSTDVYVNWALTAGTNIGTPKFGLGYQDRWILDRYWVEPPCGSGADLIDRVKGRAGISVSQGETEELWNPVSVFMGGIVGPVRAIRYIRGAASGFNTIHRDVVYSSLWDRYVDLRIHDLNDLWLYIDLLPSSNQRFFSPGVPNGVAIDGRPDASVDDMLQPWTLVRGPGGGLAVIYNVPPSPVVASRRLYYRDDSSFNDAPVYPPYFDQDDSSYGSHGVTLHGLTGDELDLIPVSWRVYPLCANEGDASLGASLRELYDVRVTTQATLQSREIEAVQGLTLQRAASDVVLAWLPAVGATTYRVYFAETADTPRSSWQLLGEVATTTFRDPGIAAVPINRFYSVVPVGENGPGPWD